MRGIWSRSFVVFAAAAAAATSSVTSQQSACTITSAARPLPAEIRETSGLTRGRTNTDVLWTHNDKGNSPELYALGADGSVKARVRLAGARISDWEDIAAGACGNQNCLYVADIGDNDERRTAITIYEVVEPRLPASQATVLSVIAARYSDGPQDAEALFRLPNGELYVITKGRKKPIKLYRLADAAINGQRVFQPVRELAPAPRNSADRITAAAASPDGEWVAIRSYSTFMLYRTASLLQNSGAPTVTFPLGSLKQRQGEAIALENDGTAWLTSEAARLGALPTLAGLRCSMR